MSCAVGQLAACLVVVLSTGAQSEFDIQVVACLPGVLCHQVDAVAAHTPALSPPSRANSFLQPPDHHEHYSN